MQAFHTIDCRLIPVCLVAPGHGMILSATTHTFVFAVPRVYVSPTLNPHRTVIFVPVGPVSYLPLLICIRGLIVETLPVSWVRVIRKHIGVAAREKQCKTRANKQYSFHTLMCFCLFYYITNAI